MCTNFFGFSKDSAILNRPGENSGTVSIVYNVIGYVARLCNEVVTLCDYLVTTLLQPC